VLEAEPEPVVDDGRARTVDDAADALRERLELQGALAYLAEMGDCPTFCV
jgi:hypothetical protein